MELSNEFTVGVPIDEAWAVLTDVERIAPCLPGAQLQEVEGDEYRGIVKVKVGPITAQYKGAASFLEHDAPLKAVLRAEGRDVRGQGNASATITATLEPEGTATRVRVVTDLTVTGRVAQFGRGVLADVSSKLMGQFVECLENDLLGGPIGVTPESSGSEQASGGGQASGDEQASGGGPAAGGQQAPAAPAPEQSDIPPEGSASSGGNGSSSTGSATRRIDHPEPTPVDLIETAGVPVAKRVFPLIGILVVVFWLLRRRRR